MANPPPPGIKRRVSYGSLGNTTGLQSTSSSPVGLVGKARKNVVEDVGNEGGAQADSNVDLGRVLVAVRVRHTPKVKVLAVGVVCV